MKEDVVDLEIGCYLLERGVHVLFLRACHHHRSMSHMLAIRPKREDGEKALCIPLSRSVMRILAWLELVPSLHKIPVLRRLF